MTSKPPTSFSPKVTKRFNDFSADIQRAVNHATHFSSYRKVAVIAFHWQNDDIGVVPLETQLLQLFASVYGFETESYEIPLAQSGWNLIEALVGWSRKYQGDDTLRIFVYSGHVFMTGLTRKEWRLA